jgi:hypothetical protein
LFTLLLGAVGGLLRAFELHLAWDKDLGLMVPYHPLSLLLLAFSLFTAVLVFCLLRAARRPAGVRVAPPKHLPLYLVIELAAALCLFASAALDIAWQWENLQILFGPRGPNTPLTGLSSLIFAVLTVFAGFCVLLIMRAGARGVLSRNYGFYMLMPVFWACFWLILDFSRHAINPVPLSYLYDMLTTVFALLSLYATAGFFFNLPRMRQTLIYAVLGAYFALTTVLGVSLYRLFWGLWPMDSMNWGNLARFAFAALHLLATVYIVRGQKFAIYKTVRPAAQETADEE